MEACQTYLGRMFAAGARERGAPVIYRNTPAKSTEHVREYLVSLWPALPFMGFGFCAAWTALAQGTAWLSPVETSGTAVTNFMLVINVAMGVCLIGAALLGKRFEALARMLADGRATMAAGVTASLGSLAMLLIGPAYLQVVLGGASHAIFQVSSLVIGVAFGILSLRFGTLYARLPLRRAILYFCYANLLAVFVYLAVQASPSWAPIPASPPLAFMAVFVALPLAAALTLRLDANGNPWVQRAAGGAVDAGAVLGDASRAGLGSLRRPMVRFSVALLLFAFSQSAVVTVVIKNAAPTLTLASSDADMLVRVPLLLAFALSASTLEARRLNLGRLLVGLVGLLEAVILLGLAAGVSGTAWLVPMRGVVFGFQALTWSLIFAMAGCHRGRSTAVVATGYGAFALGTGLGSLCGLLIADAFDTMALLVTCALALVPCFMLLDNRSTEGLFSTDVDGGASLEELLGRSLEGGAPRAKGDFRRRLDEYADARGLSAREAEALRYLVAGRGDSQIADAMGISYNTACTHVRNVYNKLGVHDRQTLIDFINGELR